MTLFARHGTRELLALQVRARDGGELAGKGGGSSLRSKTSSGKERRHVQLKAPEREFLLRCFRVRDGSRLGLPAKHGGGSPVGSPDWTQRERENRKKKNRRLSPAGHVSDFDGFRCRALVRGVCVRQAGGLRQVRSLFAPLCLTRPVKVPVSGRVGERGGLRAGRAGESSRP